MFFFAPLTSQLQPLMAYRAIVPHTATILYAPTMLRDSTRGNRLSQNHSQRFLRQKLFLRPFLRFPQFSPELSGFIAFSTLQSLKS